MSKYSTTGPHGCSDCLCCFNDISGSIEGPYCSERCKHKNESYERTPADVSDDENQYLTKW